MQNSTLIELILNHRENNPKAFASIYEVFKDLIVHYASRMCCEDGKSELDLRLVEVLHRVDITSFKSDCSHSLQKYIAVAIRNRYIDVSKKGREDVNTVQSFSNVNASFSERPDEKIIFYEAFSRLSHKQKQVLNYKLCGYEDIEIAQIMGITRQSVYGIKQRAFNTIKNFINN